MLIHCPQLAMKLFVLIQHDWKGHRETVFGSDDFFKGAADNRQDFCILFSEVVIVASTTTHQCFSLRRAVAQNQHNRGAVPVIRKPKKLAVC